MFPQQFFNLRAGQTLNIIAVCRRRYFFEEWVGFYWGSGHDRTVVKVTQDFAIVCVKRSSRFCKRDSIGVQKKPSFTLVGRLWLQPDVVQVLIA